MPDSPFVCVCRCVRCYICFGVAWWAAAVVTLSEPVSGALLLELALPSAKGSVQPDPRGPPEMGILGLFGRRGPPGGVGRDPQPKPRGPLASDNR